MERDRIAVVGGAGYIGSACARMLHASGRPVTVLDDLSTGHAPAVEGLDFLRADMLDSASLNRAFSERPDTGSVLLFAGRIVVPESVREPEAYYWNNLVGAHTLLRAMIEAGVGRIVFSSTAAVYGVPKTTPIEEEAPLEPINPYGRIKKQIEEALEDLARAGRLRYASLRYFNASGAEEDGAHGEDHEPETHLIPLAVKAALGTGNPLHVYGTDYPTPDGSCIRDYVHVRDLARAHQTALDALEDAGGPPGRVYNLGSGTGWSVFQVLDAVSKAVGSGVPFDEAPRREGDPPALVAASGRIRRELGWEPEFGLDAIVESAVRWHRNHPRGYETGGP
jgi:UDP-glucose 4-epimerase